MAENLFNDSQLGASADLTIGATGTRLAVLDTLEKCEIARAFVNNANSKHYMGLKQRELTTSYATLYKKFDFWEWIDACVICGKQKTAPRAIFCHNFGV